MRLALLAFLLILVLSSAWRMRPGADTVEHQQHFRSSIPRETATLRHPASTFTPTPSPAPKPPIILDIEFLDSQHGWLYLGHCTATPPCTVSLSQTSDGGRHWQLLPAPPQDSAHMPGQASDYDLVMVSAHDGWLVGSGLLATHDGGRSWITVPLAGQLIAFAATQQSVWLIMQQSGPNDPPTWILRRSRDQGRSWREQPLAMPPKYRRHPQGVLTRIDEQVAFFRPRTGNLGSVPNLVTTDGGVHWQTVQTPCRGYPLMTATSRQQWWLLCIGDPGVGMQMKRVYRSDDGGHQWHLMATSTGAQPRLPAGGYAGYLVVTDEHTAFMPMGRGLLLRTNDGGKNWDVPIPDERTILSGTAMIKFVDAQSGWVAIANSLYTTNDGGQSWKRQEIP